MATCKKARNLFDNSLKTAATKAQQYINLGYWALRVERPAQAEQYFSKRCSTNGNLLPHLVAIAHAKTASKINLMLPIYITLAGSAAATPTRGFYSCNAGVCQPPSVHKR